MQSRASLAADGMSSVSSAWVEPNLPLICLARKEPNAFAANLGTVIKEHPFYTRGRSLHAMPIITGRRYVRNGAQPEMPNRRLQRLAHCLDLLWAKGRLPSSAATWRRGVRCPW